MYRKPVVTGQQIGLLGGPLYTTYKVLGTIHASHRLKGDAIYWLETNDADFNEINHIDFIDSEGNLKHLYWDIDSNGLSCGYIKVDSHLVSILETFFSSLTQTEFTPQLRELVIGCYKPGRTMGEASWLLASELFKDFELTLFDPSGKEFKDFCHPLLLKEAKNTPTGGQCNLFCMVGEKREAVFRFNGRFQLRDGTPVELTEMDLVPNLKTRNICQDSFFLTHSYIAGPAEIEYISDLNSIYRFHKVKKAKVVPRMSITLVEPKVRRLLEKTGLSLKDVFGIPKENLAKKVLKERTGFDHTQAAREAKIYTDEYVTRLKENGLTTDDIQKFLRKEVKKVIGLRRAREKAAHNKFLKNTHFLSDSMWPLGKKQERIFNVFYYMNLYKGLDFIKWLYGKYNTVNELLEISDD